MARAYPSHAATILCDGGPPAVLAHFACPEGHFDCCASSVRVLSVAQQRQVESMRERLERAHRKIAQLTPAPTQISDFGEISDFSKNLRGYSHGTWRVFTSALDGIQLGLGGYSPQPWRVFSWDLEGIHLSLGC
jgi:hypothetical protein